MDGIYSPPMTRTRSPQLDAQLFGEIFRTLREQRGWTITTCARRLGISRTHLGVLEAGRNMPSVEFLLEFADTFSIAPSTLMHAFEEGRKAARESVATAE